MTHANLASRRARRTVLLGCIVAWLVAFAATHTPIPVPPRMEFSDKTLHVAGYFALSTVFWLTLLAYGRTAPARACLTGIVMAAYGGFDELTQPLFNRSASFDDWVADLCGIVIAVVAMQSLLHIRSALRRRRRQA